MSREIEVTLTYTEEEAQEVARTFLYFTSNVSATREDHDRMALIRSAIKAKLTPPIEEPTEAASLVEDEDGAIWGRQCTQGGGKDMSRPWMQLVNGRTAGPLDRERDWRDINVVRVLSEGVPAEATR